MGHQFVVIGDAFSGTSDAGSLTDQLAAMGYARYREVHSANLAALWACLERERWLAVAREPGADPPACWLSAGSSHWELMGMWQTLVSTSLANLFKQARCPLAG